MKKHVLLIISLAVSTIFTANLAFAANVDTTVVCPSPLVSPKTWKGSLAAGSCPNYMVTSTSPVLTCTYTPIGKGYCRSSCNCTGTLKPTSNPTTPPTTSGTTTNDIAKAGLSPPKTKSVNFTSQTSNSTPIIQDYNGTYLSGSGTLNPCPNDPATVMPNYKYTTLQGTYTASRDYSPLPLDIEGNRAASVSTDPPEQCIVRRLVLYQDQTTSVVSPGPPVGNVKLYAVVTPLCPDGYAQVGAYDMQPEIKYNSDSTPIYPKTIAEIDSLTQRGYSCTNDTPNTLYSTCLRAYSDSSINFVFNVPINQYYPVTKGQTNVGSGSTPIVNSSFYKDGVVKFIRLYGAYDDYINYDFCDASSDSSDAFASDVNCSTSYGATSSTMHCTYVVAFGYKVNYEYAYQVCKLPVGLYSTGNSIPSTLVCARIKSKYNQMNK